MPPTQTVRFLVISDTFDEIPEIAPAHPLSRLPEVDVVLHCGNLTRNGRPDDIRRAISWIRNLRARLKIIIPGNHDISFDSEFWESQGGDVKESLDVIQELRRDNSIELLDEGTWEFTLRQGATFRIHVSSFTPGYGTGAFQYHISEDRFNPSNCSRPGWGKSVPAKSSVIPQGVDILMTHGPPQGILTGRYNTLDSGCPHLLAALNRVRPKLHVFGHSRAGYGAQRISWSPQIAIALPDELVNRNIAIHRGHAVLNDRVLDEWRREEQTLCLNACVLNHESRVVNHPWRIDMVLPVSTQPFNAHAAHSDTVSVRAN